MTKPQRPAPAGFPILLKEIKARIQQPQTRAILAANTELVQLYWDIGRMIDIRQQQEGWGAAVISEYELTRALPTRLQSALPTVEEIEADLAESATAKAGSPKAKNPKADKAAKPPMKRQQKKGRRK